MKTALFIYILLGVLSIVPLIIFNIRKIWVKRPPDPIRFNPGPVWGDSGNLPIHRNFFNSVLSNDNEESI